MIETLCGRFFGLSPLEVMNSETRDVYDLYCDIIIHDSNTKKDSKGQNEVWVTSKNATWH